MVFTGTVPMLNMNVRAPHVSRMKACIYSLWLNLEQSREKECNSI